MMPSPETFRVGKFELSAATGELKKDGRPIKLQPQPFKLLLLLVRRAGTLVTRDEIRQELWPDGTFVDFDQAVNFAVKQVRTVLGDDAERPVYVETVPRRGYRFIAPVDIGGARARASGSTTLWLQKALWQNVAELRMAEERRRRYRSAALAGLAIVVLLALIYILTR